MRSQILSLVVAVAFIASAPLSRAQEPAGEAALASRGLVRVGSAYLLKDDIALAAHLKPVRELEQQMALVNRDRGRFERDIRVAEKQIVGWRAEYDVLKEKIKKTKDPANHNQYVAPINALVKKINGGLAYCESTQKAIDTLPDLKPQHADAVGQAVQTLEAAVIQYEALAADPAVVAAINGLNKPGAARVTLGPTPALRKELYVLRLGRQGYDPTAYLIKYRDVSPITGLGTIDATLNGSAAETLVVDPDALFVVVTPAVATKLGLRATADARVTKVKTADGKFVDAKLAVLSGVTVGRFTVPNVECALHPGGEGEVPLRIGKSFLKHFAVGKPTGGISLIPLAEAPVKTSAPMEVSRKDENIFEETEPARGGAGPSSPNPSPKTSVATTVPASRQGEVVRMRLPAAAANSADARAALADGRDPGVTVLTDTFAFDPGEPYRLPGTLKVDEKAKKVEIIVPAGAEVRGGKIYLARAGKLKLQGTPDRPAILRNVQIVSDLNGSLEADYAILDNCTFSKGGSWFSWHSSKWTFRNCTLYKSKFSKLSGVDYGFRIESCRLIEMTFPEIQPRREKDKEFNHMSHLRKDWNRIRGCEFVSCTVPPTVAWCAEGSAFIDCSFVPGQAFEGKTDFVWEAFVAGTKGSLPQAVYDANPGSRGRAVAASLSAFPDVPILGAKLIPEIVYTERQVRREQ